MEENKSKKTNEKLSYEELNKAASDLHVQYQKLAVEYQKAMKALNDREFDYMSVLIQMLFKVMDHPEMYKDSFVKWASETIEDAVRSFSDSMIKPTDSPSGEEKADEAE